MKAEAETENNEMLHAVSGLRCSQPVDDSSSAEASSPSDSRDAEARAGCPPGDRGGESIAARAGAGSDSSIFSSGLPSGTETTGQHHSNGSSIASCEEFGSVDGRAPEKIPS